MVLGITTIQRDRAPWIKEWIAFHYLVGFKKFYFYAHNCRDNSVEVLQDLKKNFDISIFPTNVDDNLIALKCFQGAYENFGY